MDPLRISLVGLSRWESVFVETTVNLASGIDIAPWRLVDDPDGADVLLVDADRRGLIRDDDSHPDGSNRPIVISFTGESTERFAGSGRGLTRPVSYAELISALQDIEAELTEPATVPQEPASRPDETGQASEVPQDAVPKPDGEPGNDLADAQVTGSAETLVEKARPARRFVEGTRFLGLLKQTLERGHAAEIRHPDYPSVLVFPEHNAYASTGDATSMPRLFRASAMDFARRDIDDDVAAAALSTGRCRPLGRLVYCAALFGCEGRLVLNCDPEDRLRLIDWPDFDAVPHLPEHREIAKFMLVNTADLAEIAAATGVSIGVVIAFCNACEAVGLVRRTPEARAANGAAENNGVTQILGRVRDLFGMN